MSIDNTALQVPAHSVPAPTSISAQGQAYLAATAKRLAEEAVFPENKSESLGRIVALADSMVEMLRHVVGPFKGSFETLMLPNNVKLYRATPDGCQGPLASVALLDIHGGGFAVGGGEMCQLLTQLQAGAYGVKVYSVDYRLIPEHQFPDALDDCMAVYRKLLETYAPSSIVVSGASAGGNLAAALLLRAQEEGLPLPAGLLLSTPALDLTESGDSFKTNRYLDVNLIGVIGVLAQYAPGKDLTHPYISPLFGQIGPNWPPTLLMSGTRDMLLSDTVRMHRVLRKAGVNAELHVNEASPHGGFILSGAPEDMDMIVECRRFIYTALGV